MSKTDTTDADAALRAARPEGAESYCCECGTYDLHKARCLCCGFDFRAAPEVGPSAAG